MALGTYDLHHSLCNAEPREICYYERNPPRRKAVPRRNDSEMDYLLSLRTSDLEAVDKYGNTNLMRALLRNFDSAVEFLLKREVNVNAKNCAGKTALHFAIIGGNEKYINILIEKGADINSQDRKGKTPLSKAVEINSESAVKILVAKLCDVNLLDKNGNSSLQIALNKKLWKIAEILLKYGSDLAQQNKSGETPLHIAAHKGVLLGDFYCTDVQVIQDLLTKPSANELESIWKLLLENDAEENSKIVNIKNNRGKTALHIAAESYKHSDIANITYHDYKGEQKRSFGDMQQGYKEICKILLANGASVNEMDEDGNAPIHTAVQAVNTELLKIILDSGADVNCVNKYGKTSLHIAIEKHRICEEHCKMLVAYGARVNMCDGILQTPLYIAAKADHEKILHFLIDNGADVHVRDKYGNSPLHIAALSGSSCHLSIILNIYPLVNHKNDKGMTPLHNAALSFKDAEQKCEILIRAGADVRVKDNFNGTPLHLAALSGYDKVGKLLIENGADIDAIDIKGYSPANTVANIGCCQFMKYLLDNGASINQKGRRGRTPLHHAVGNPLVSKLMCKLLLERGADITARDNNQQTPLHLAIKRLALPTVRLLLEAGAEVNAQDNKGQTPMHLIDYRINRWDKKICQYDPSAFVKDMLEWGASSTLKNEQGNTPLQYTMSALPTLYTNRIQSIIICHMIKCKSAKLYTDLECVVDSDINYKDFEIFYSNELSAMKNTVIGQHSLLDVFSKYNDPTYLANCELEAAIVSDEMLKFPIYGSLLRTMFKRANVRLRLFSKALDILEMPLPNEIVWSILSYLSDIDLENVIKAKELAPRNDKHTS